MEKENDSNESDFKENEIPDLNSLKQKQTSEILTVAAVIMRKMVSRPSAVQKQSLADVLQNRCQACKFIKKRLQHRCFVMKFTKSLREPFLQNTSTQCYQMKTITESLSCRKKKSDT